MDKENSVRSDASLTDLTRRTFLRASAAAGALAAVSGIGAAQDVAETFELGGEVPGWQGRAPSDIEGQTNPTLQLEAGQTYEITWENLDGAPHNVVIVSGDGSEIERTELMSEQGQTQTLTFEATEEMAEYYCEAHPSSMRGQVQIGGGGGTQTETPQDQEPLITEGPQIGLQQVADGALRQPVDFAIAQGDDRRFIVDQHGQIYVHGSDGLQDEPFLDIQDKLHYLTDTKGGFDRSGDFDERGLLGLAFHPDFSNNGKFYVRYSAPPKTEDLVGPPNREGIPEGPDHTEVLAEYTVSDDGTADPGSERMLLEIPSPQFNHNAGDVAFGPDGYLYIPMGDGGGANDTHPGHVDDWYDQNEGGNGQDTTQNLLGSILRIDVDGESDDRPYGIPDDNPFVGSDAGFDEYFAWGLRNPYRFSFADDGRMFVADVGQGLYEEVNIVENGGNYGWNVKEATHCFSTDNPAQPPDQCPNSTPDNVRGGEELVDPVIEYPHAHNGQPLGTAVVGGYVYNGSAVSDLNGMYVFGDWSAAFDSPSGNLWVAQESDGGDNQLWSIQELVVQGGAEGKINRFINAFGQDHDGEIYVLTSNTGGLEGNGEVFKIVTPDQGDEVGTPEQTPTETPEGESDGGGGGGGNGMDGETPSIDQPGFGALSALAGIAGGVKYLVGRDDEE